MQVLMFHTSAILTGLTLAVLPLMLLAFQVCCNPSDVCGQSFSHVDAL
jgi:hypothetical protein